MPSQLRSAKKNTIKVAVVDSNQHYDLLLKSGLWNNDSQRILLKPNIALGHPDELQSPTARSMLNLCVEQNLLEGPLAAQDAYQLLCFARELATSYGRVEVVVGSSGGVGFYLLQMSKLGLNPPNIFITCLEVERLSKTFIRHETFPTSIDHLAAFSQEILSSDAVDSMQSSFSSISGPPLTVTACITHRNRPALLSCALKSLLEQTVLPAEILIIDDGSDSPEAMAVLDAISEKSFAVPVIVRREVQRYLGAARNAGWKAAKCSHVLFLDDDDIAKPNMIESLANAAKVTDAAVVTSFMEYFAEHAELEREQPKPRWLPLGNCPDVGCFANLFGSANSLIKKQTLEDANGFVETFGAGHEDWEFYLRVCLAGKRIELVPESLFYCRRTEVPSMLTSTSQYRNYRNNLQPVLNGLPKWARIVFTTGFSAVTRNEGRVRDMWRQRHVRSSIWNPISSGSKENS